jgi:hypothetical protein
VPAISTVAGGIARDHTVHQRIDWNSSTPRMPASIMLVANREPPARIQSLQRSGR